MTRLDGRIAVVTGGANGIGKAIAQRLSAEGARIAITDRDIEAGERLARAEGFDFLEHDVSDESRWAEIAETIEERFGRIDILVNNAGIVGARDLANPENARLDDWKAVFAINVEGVFLGSRTIIPAMRRAGGGAIVNISSTAALMATPHSFAYGASKAAVRHMTQSIAQYCCEQGLSIRCNSVHPGNIYGPLWDRIAEEAAAVRNVSVADVIAEAEARNPMGGFSQADDVAAVVAFLVSDDASRMTGDRILIDGGSVSCSSFHMSERYAQALARSSVDLD